MTVEIMNNCGELPISFQTHSPRMLWTQTLHLLPMTQCKQEAQLLQRDRAMLRVIEDFATSHKVIQNNIVEKGVSPFTVTMSDIFSVK